ncbi:ATP-binding protein [Achromobacter aegrifaciens]|uniref:DNA mismatch repair protein n=1 Tax=Achromobacter aegrifaciens TaxID=1287736 RepID=A0AAD2J229_ACHAE|nr:ATP-binding protein [Achromobacter aegrifaciens]CUJ42688.1 DNA mismatch repair protein [Achromobacter aegrifaciens]
MTRDLVTPDEQNLLRRVQKERDTGIAVEAVLKTNARVFARITDGIYREPASALRELVANAYDADATEVRIYTDAPRFSQITVRDNGFGLSEDALVHVISNIGGSLKRTNSGASYNVTSSEDPTLSPGNRKLIGKLGIGLFSVSQLTHHLVIVTKIKGEAFRRVCDIMLMPQKDLETADDSKEFVTGNAVITTIAADDVENHGTDITLHNIRDYVRHQLRSSKDWESLRVAADRKAAIERARFGCATEEDLELIETINSEDDDDGFTAEAKEPIFHIGEVSPDDPETLVKQAALPWIPTDGPLARFKKLVDGIVNFPLSSTKEKIKINDVLDNYFQMLWTISLCVPLPYIEKHPFSLTENDGIPVYGISNKVRGGAVPIELKDGVTVASAFDLKINEISDFRVLIDDVELRRPILMPPTSSDDQSPLLFVGKLSSDLAALPKDFSGGPLEFQAYLCWTKRVVPAEHNGVMIRVHGASGILFDEHFLKYQVAEQNRLRQITAEVFVTKGLDAAQNIDRESFNVSHPHYQILSNWIHHALRQLNTRHKALQRTLHDSTASVSHEKAEQKLKEIVSLASPTSKAHGQPTSVRFIDRTVDLVDNLSADVVALDRSAVFSSASISKPVTRNEKRRASFFESQIVAVTSVLNDFGLLSSLDTITRERLIKAIVEIFSVDGKK